MSVLLTGGAGYIGSLTNQYLKSQGIETVVFDNLSSGHFESIPQTAFFYGDLRSKNDLSSVFSQYFIEGVIHFGALALAGESMEKPREYYENNVMGTINLLDVMKDFKCQEIVFSSSCSIFGTPSQLPVTEDFAFAPESVYAETKMLGEKVLDRYDQLFGIKSVKLRYFNAAGAALDGTLGEEHKPETHIIPNLINAVLHHTPFTLYGNDYPTVDGSCVRDYVHVLDLAQAHFLALQYLKEKHTSNYFNLGSEKGMSNLEILHEVEKVSGQKIDIKIAPRRLGDPAAIYANAHKAKQILGWQPQFSTTNTIVESAWNWHSQHSK